MTTAVFVGPYVSVVTKSRGFPNTQPPCWPRGEASALGAKILVLFFLFRVCLWIFLFRVCLLVGWLLTHKHAHVIMTPDKVSGFSPH